MNESNTKWTGMIGGEMMEAKSDPFATLKAMMRQNCGASDEQAQAALDKMLSNVVVNCEEE